MPDLGGFYRGEAVNALQRGINSALPASTPGRSIRSVTGRTRPVLRSAADPFADGRLRNWRSIVMQVRHILLGKGRDVMAIANTATVCDAAKLLTEKKIGALVVKDKGGKLIGIISERDLVRAMAEGGAASFTDPVGDHMTPAPQTCIENDTVESVMEVMTRGRFRHVPVLDDGMRLCGMISIGDVVKTRIAETVSEAAALRDYISAAV
jgi:CBS domain-containing protein